MPRWSAGREGKILVSLFENGMADPRHVNAADIDPIKELREEFKDFSKETWRRQYQNTANSWMAGKAVEGTRRQALNFDNLEKEDDLENNEEEEFEEEQPIVEPPPKRKMTTPSKTKPTVSSAYKYKNDEKKWDPIFQSSKFISNGYHREELIVEPPASFDGAEGTYQVSFDNNNTVLVLKIAPNLALSDPHDINSYYSQKYGIVTAVDSARDQAFKEASKSNTDKWYTYRHRLSWAGKPSEDLGMMPWLDFADIESNGRVFPLLIINLSSISPIEEKPKKMTGGLRRNKFASPPKVTGVNLAGDPNAQMAALLEQMFKAGMNSDKMTPEMKEQARKFGYIDPDPYGQQSMETGGSDSKKRHIDSGNNDNDDNTYSGMNTVA